MNLLPADDIASAADSDRVAASNAQAIVMPSTWRRVLATWWCVLALVLVLVPASQAAVSAIGSPAQVAANTSLPFTVPAGTNRLLVVTASNASSTAVPTVSFGATPMTLVVQRNDGFAMDSMWRLALGTSASSTSGTITVSGFAVAANTVVTAQTFDGVDQTTPIDGTGTQQTSTGSNVGSTITLNTTTAGDLVFDIFDSFVNSGAITATPGGAQTGIHDVPLTVALPGTGNGRYRTSRTPGLVGSTTVSWTSNTIAILHLAANINAANVLPSADLSITKTNGTTTSVPGGSTTYTITASNAGPDPATATVADTFPATLTCNWTCVGAGGGTCTASGGGNINDSVNLPVGGSVAYTAVCGISAAATGTLSNTATVTAAVTDPTPGNNSATDTNTLVPSTDVSITKTNGTANSTPGGSTTYTIVASNSGPSTATGVTVSDTFPAVLTCNTTSATAGGASGNDTPIAGNISDGGITLPPGSSVTYTAVCGINAGATGSLVNTASVSAATTDPSPGNNSATDTDTLLSSANLGITKTDGTPTAVPGASTTYTITASNAGPSNVTGATVADTFPAALTCTWTCVGAGGGTCTAAGAGNINQSVNLPSGGSVTITASCSISAAATGSLVNTATVSSAVFDPNGGNNSATDTDTLAPTADLSITKTDGVVSVFAGGNTTYTITTSNAGPSNAPGATVSDTFPATLTCTWTCAGAGGGTCTAAGAGNINDTVNLPAGGSVTHTASCAISAAASGSLVNTATVTAPGGLTDSNGGNNSATDTDTISALPTLSINDVSVAEGNGGTGILTFTVTRTGAAAGAVGFDFATSDGTATTANTDYVTASGTGSIASGGATGTTTISVTINGDAFFENNETFNVTLSAPTGAVIADATGVGTITNDDTVPTLAINDVSVTEGNSGTQNLVFTVTRTGLTNLPADFSAATANGTATAPSDYLAALVGSTSIAAGGATGTTTLSATINGDAVVEANEMFVVNLSAPSNATIADNQGTGTITNDDTAGIVLTQSAGSTDVTEGGVTDSYTLVLTSQPTANVSVALNADGQVTAATSPVVFTTGNWATPQPVTVTAVDDVIVEGAHTGTITHTVTSADATYNGFTVANVVANVTDNDLPTLAINDVSIAEGNASTQTLTFTVTRTGTSASAVGFTFATANDTATTADGDYVAAGGTGTIPGGGATGTTTISVTINGDATFENNESFFVNLTAPTNATIADAQGIGTITNDDTAPTLTINDVSIVEGNTGTQNLVFTVTRTGLTALPASFTAATADGFATAPSDYLAALVGSTTIAAGGATGTTTLSATINGDFIVETNEPFFVNLSAPANATISDNQGIGTITNDDTAGISVVQSGGTTNVTEGGATDTYTVVLTSQPTANVSIALNGGTQVTPSPTPLLFTSGNWNLPQTVTVMAVDDAVIEGNHSGAVTSAVTSVNGIYNGFVVAPVSVAITDNDTPGVTLVESGGNTLVTEGGATDTYTMVLTSQPSANVTVTPNGGTQLASPAAVVFTNANWNLPQTVTVTATDDNVVEGTHSGSLTHTVASADTNYAGLVIGQVTGSITDNDSAVVAFDPISVSQSEASSPMAFTVTLSNPVASGVTVTVDSTPGTATAADFTPIVAGTVSFAANSTTSQTVNVVINNDALDENDESFTLTLSGVTATGNVTLGTAVATGTIQDDDLPPVISITSPSQLEGNAGTAPLNFVVSLSVVSGRDVTFTRATANGTATVANNDYVPLTAVVATIPAGQQSISIPVLINGDTVFEGNESFSLLVTGISNATPASITGTGTIEEDDQQPTTTAISSDLPDPSVVGQPYTVNVTVNAQTTSPLGAVTISDGSDSCGPITLTTGTPPASSASCQLTSSTAGAKMLTATYAPASTAFAASSDTEAHQVNAAATAISVSGPARSRINQPISFSFMLSVLTPGGGTPTGVVTLSTSGSSCQVSVPTATPNCSLSFGTLGPATVSASFVPGNGNHLASTSSGVGNASTFVFALADLQLTKTDVVGTYLAGDLLVYTVTLRNLGPDAAVNLHLSDLVPVGLIDVRWTCDASGGLSCPQNSGNGELDVAIPAFPVGGLLNYSYFGNADGSPAQIVNSASVTLPADTRVEDPNLGNNSATVTSRFEHIFADGFEAALVMSPEGSYTLSSDGLTGLLDEVARILFVLDDAHGHAARIYARQHAGQAQFALAQRDGSGRLRLGKWQQVNSGIELNWTARETARGWMVESVELR